MGLRIPFRLTLLGRSTVLLAAEVLANAILWIVAAILFARKPETRSLLSLALLAWTLGLRHALDADHISAIDNATRGLINMGQLPVTCGLFFSLGHSTIVIVITIAIAISTDVFERMTKVGEVGGIIGPAVSGSFLFIVGLANTIILWRIVKRRREAKRREDDAGKEQQLGGLKLPSASPNDVRDKETADSIADEKADNRTLTMRIIGPIMSFVDRPWKMYPVGVLFGFGFDTASSIALLAIAAVAKRNGASDGDASSHTGIIPSSYVVILPLLFTAGMTMIDSVDSVIMLYSYTGFPQHNWKFIEARPAKTQAQAQAQADHITSTTPNEKSLEISAPKALHPHTNSTRLSHSSQTPRIAQDVSKDKSVSPEDQDELTTTTTTTSEDKVLSRAKANVMSGLSIILTVMSILLAFTISLITLMGLIGENCAACVRAAQEGEGRGGGLAGRWWRGWFAAGEQSGWIGIGIVGGFVVVVAGWYGIRFVLRRSRRRGAPIIGAAATAAATAIALTPESATGGEEKSGVEKL